MYKNRIKLLESQLEKLMENQVYLELTGISVLNKKATEERVSKAWGIQEKIREMKGKQRLFDGMKR